ncbi:MAG TPA: hypothetical protein VFG64_04435 [Dongiaceae bacterium]|nr:hypothetical protein [Dongiaceae bacterium]
MVDSGIGKDRRVAAQSWHSSELPAHLREAVRNARMAPEHNALDRLLEE